MAESSLGYREVIPDQSGLDFWKEITLTTGGAQSTLQDIKISERANGFSYEDSSKYYTRNRFIYWRIINDVLELVEHSLDINLTGNRIRYRFTDTPILDGVSIYESVQHVIVLVPTVCSIHRLIFPHPDRFHKQKELLGTHPDLAAPSIFATASPADAKNTNTFYVFNNPNTANDQLPHLACSYMIPDTEEAFFVLAYPSNELLLLRQHPDGRVFSNELKGESLMPRFLSGLAERFRNKGSDADNIVGLLILSLDYEIYAVTLTRDGHLKFWSCSKAQCVAVVDILAEIGDISKQLVQNAILRKAVDNSENCILSVFLSFSSECKFYILKPAIKNQQIRIHNLLILSSPENDLIDFTLTSTKIWSAWRCEDGECSVFTCNLESERWTPVLLEALPDPAETLSNRAGEADPRQIYLEHIFYPGRFPLHIISKALSIYKKTTILSEANISPTTLKQRICIAVESEIQNLLEEKDVNDEEYLECSGWCWQKFYSCVVQYHIAGLKPLGLLLLPSVGGAVFLKKSTYSFLRPLDALEHMSLCSDFMYQEDFSSVPALAEDLDTTEDVMRLFQVIVYLEQQMSEEFFGAFTKGMAMLEPPEAIMAQLLDKINKEMDSEFTTQVTDVLKEVSDLYKAMHKVLELLRFDNIVIDEDFKVKPNSLLFFNSQLGVSVLAGCLRQQAHTRFSICRNLLLLCTVLMSQRKMDWGILEAVRSVCMPEIVVLTQASYVMYWLSSLPATVNLPLESSLQRLAPLKLSPVFNLRTNGASLIELFMASSGGLEARKSFAKHADEEHPQWNLTMLPYLNYLRHNICPVRGSTVLPEWLLTSGQHLWLQQYVRLLSNWCEWNSCTRSFLLAASYLTSGENYKAQELFETASKGVFTDKFLEEKILKGPEDTQKAYILYFLKVIQLFELHKARDCVINIASIALSICEEGEPLRATLYSIKFKHHLALKHYEKAFDALNSNPDDERKKDNLRDLVKHLLDERKLDVLLSFTYGGLEEFFHNILLSRARASEPLNNIFYDFIYSYQMKRGPLCYRLAASAMYERAYRLSQLEGINALEKQVKCLLAAKNVLQLVEKAHAWVLKPYDEDEQDEIVLEPLAGTGTLETLKRLKIKKQVEVVNVEIIKKELIFANAKLKLAHFSPSSSTNISTPTELVVLLNNAGLFKTALQICSNFDLSYVPVFEGLTKYCIMLTEDESPNAWDWLVENDLQDLPPNRDCLADVVWQLLQDYLEKFEKPNLSELHYAVCKKIIAMQMYLPYWILSSYRKRNPSELLKLLHSTGRLEEGVELARDYMLAALGDGKELFGFKTPLIHNAPAFCLPVYTIKNLIEELKIQNVKNPERPFQTEYSFLSELFKKYMETAVRISNEMQYNPKYFIKN